MGWLQHHDDEASKSEKEAEKDKGIKEEGYDDSWLNDSATPGRMCTDPVRGCIVASGALPRLWMTRYVDACYAVVLMEYIF